MKGSRPILLVEDDAVDQMLLRRAMEALEIPNRLEIASDGEEALALLHGSRAEERPCLIMIDMNMPKMNGLEFVRELRKEDTLKVIPVIVLSTSKEKKDVSKSYGLGVAGYFAKPVDYLQFVEIIRAIHQYWSLCERPD